ncbi:phosphate ABC transporter substrate-binding/OmpA family protein [Pelagovum pacificum]|uniref:phosphate ABC transporter substrate-binding/OmpA family protein n=1 Tax=Pelagovum pacificum TaxID=2588711 RepID=UPI001E433630|nr:phosphate ABC transporter substrate-binding/OmpA family protein [Pelagovum pacificum]
MKRAAIFAALFFCGQQAAAQDITVSHLDGGVELTGRYLGFDGRYLRMDSTAGPVTLDYQTVSCSGDACPDPQGFTPELRLAGARRMGEVLMPALVAGYANARNLSAERVETDRDTFSYVLSDPESGIVSLRIDFSLSTSDGGIEALVTNEADMAFSVRPITREERDRGIDAGLGDLGAPERSRIVAIDAVVPVVSAAQDLHEITITDLIAAFSGDITNWSALGGPDEQLVPHLGTAGSADEEGFTGTVMNESGDELSPDILRHASPAGLLASIGHDPKAIGIASYQSYGDAHPLAVSGGCGLRIDATLETLKTQDYPLSMPLFLYMPMRRVPPVVTDFLDWLRTQPAQFVVRRAGFVDLGASRIPIDAQGHRFVNAIAAADPESGLVELQRLVDGLGDKERLSLTFRFEQGSTDLDALSRSNIFQLAREIRDGQYDGATLLLVGFTDGRGPAAANKALASARAQAVLEQLIAALGGALPRTVRVRTDAYGETLPMGCDDSRWGRQINRRVELWIGD